MDWEEDPPGSDRTRREREGLTVTDPDPVDAEPRSPTLLSVGAGGVVAGTVADAAPVVWAGVGVVALAFGRTTAARFGRASAVRDPGDSRAVLGVGRAVLALAAAWAVLALSVVGLLATYAHGRYGPGDGTLAPALAATAVGAGLVHAAVGARRRE